MNKTRLAVVVSAILVTGLFFWLDLGQYLTLDTLQSRHAELQAWVDGNLSAALPAFFGLYVAVTALNIPGAAIMTLAAGALFGLLPGALLVSFASTLGATLAFLLSRFLLRDWVEARFGSMAGRINEGISREGAYYLFTLRLVPAFPFFVINMVMGLTRLRVLTFYLVSQIGMLPGTLVYVNAGTQLGQIETTADILSPGLIGSFILLGLFPLAARRLMAAVNRRRQRRTFPRPRRYDANLVVIGAGSAGLVTAYIAAASKARVVLIEQHRMGGDCLNTGCVPSKALIRASRIASYIRRAEEFGLGELSPEVDFPRVMQRVREVIAAIEPHDSVERYTGLGVECIAGSAKITSPCTVEVDGRVITTRSIVIASGGRPAVPPIPGLEQTAWLTSDTIWELTELPKRFLVLGGGPIGCELAQAFQRLGSRVTLIEALPRLLVREDPEVSEAVAARFAQDGMKVLTGYRAAEFRTVDSGYSVRCTRDDQTVDVAFDRVLVATGRRANTAGLGLEEIGVRLNDDGTVAVNEYLQATYDNIYACGDVAGPYQLTHAAGHQAWYCAFNALFGRFRKFRVDYSIMPWAVFTDPEVARVGLNEQDAQQRGIDYEVTRYGIDDLDRAIADGEAHGFIKVLTARGKDRILGVTIVGPHAGDTIAEYITAIKHGLGMKKILGTIHIYPTLSEANRFAGGEWRRAHLSPRLLSMAERYNRWRRK